MKFLSYVIITSSWMTSCVAAPDVEITSSGSEEVHTATGMILTITCEFRGLTISQMASAQIFWERSSFSSRRSDLERVESDGEHYLVERSTFTDKLASRLNVIGVTFDDAGIYDCVGEMDGSGDFYDSFYVYVTGRPEIIDVYRDVQPIAGGAVTLTCLAQGRPIPTLEWRGPDNVPVAQLAASYSSSTSSVSDSVVESQVTLYSLTSDVTGDYRCVARNDNGSRSDFIDVNLDPFVSIHQPGTSFNTSDTSLIVVSIFFINIECTAFNVPLYQQLSLEWKVQADSWYSQGYRSVTQSNKYSVTTFTSPSPDQTLGNMTSVLRFDADFSDQGKYRCRLYNDTGTQLATQTRELRIEGVPIVAVSPAVVEASIGMVYNVTCTAEARPALTDLYWARDGIRIPSVTYAVDSYSTETSVLISVSSRNVFDIQYSCWAVNRLDLDECATNVCDSVGSDLDCVNTVGSYRCVCPTGYVQNDFGDCVDSNYPQTSTTKVPGPTTTSTANTQRRSSERSNSRRENPKHNIYATTFANDAFSNTEQGHTYARLPPDPAEFPRERLQLEDKLGSGKFGTVYRALALSLSRSGKWERVAVKMMKEAATEGEKSDFIREMSLLRSLPPHPHLVGFLAYCTKSDPTLIIMEFCEHGDLMSHLRKRRPGNSASPGNALSNDLVARDLFTFALHTARGMAHIANHKIVHRDVATRNVLLTERNVCKVSDFGLARYIDDNDVYELGSKRPLPIRWMAPESLRDGVHTSQSDVWAYGVLLWEIVTLGASPFPGMSGKVVMEHVISGTRLEIPPQCSPELSDIMTSCWAMRPDERPTFDVIAGKFEQLLEKEGDYLRLDSLGEGTYHVLAPSESGERV
ncbi:hypothetical protein BaRGS_00008872 [Batillaria attramentaria]|uniref:receptor protein-tyrosine kinase n=1 Tax=Batillaria attramentaria TaxID=370345 RepID=A0ABD0LJU5_9CAEN